MYCIHESSRPNVYTERLEFRITKTVIIITRNPYHFWNPYFDHPVNYINIWVQYRLHVW